MYSQNLRLHYVAVQLATNMLDLYSYASQYIQYTVHMFDKYESIIHNISDFFTTRGKSVLT